MKEKIRELFIPVALFYMIIIIALSLISYFNAKGVIELNTLNNFNNDISNYKLEVNNISNKVCQDYLNSFIDYVIRSNYNGEVNVKDYFARLYLSEEYLLSYYLKGKDSCLFTDEKASEYNLRYLFLTA